MANQYTIGEASKIVGLSAKTIRYYESIQLINSSKRKENNYRLYSENDIQKLRMVVEAKSLGVPLDEVKNIVSACFDDGCTHLKEYLKKRIPEYLSQTEAKIQELNKFKKRLRLLQKKFKSPLEEDCVECSEKDDCYKYLQV